MLLIIFLVLIIASFAFADSWHDQYNTYNNTYNTTNPGGAGGNASATATVGNVSGGTATINDNSKTYNTNTNTNLNTNINNNNISNKIDNKNTNMNTNMNFNNLSNRQSQGQGQSQKQRQGQDQGQSQFGYVNIESPQALLPSPNVIVPPLYFGNGRMEDATSGLPTFALYGITPLLRGEVIMEVISVNANVKFKNLYETILDDAKAASGKGKAIRYQVIRAQGQKTWTFGANLAGAGSALPSINNGASGMGGIGPQWGGTKADDLFTVIFVKVATSGKYTIGEELKPKAKPVVLYEKKLEYPEEYKGMSLYREK